jgi:hypothetical protein
VPGRNQWDRLQSLCDNSILDGLRYNMLWCTILLATTYGRETLLSHRLFSLSDFEFWRPERDLAFGDRSQKQTG